MTKPVTGLTVFGSNTSGTTTQLDNNFLALQTAINDFNTYSNYLVDTGAANAYVVNLPASTTGLLTDGLQIQVKVGVTNSGASQLNYNATGNANIINLDGSGLSANQMLANSIVGLAYSNSSASWQLQTVYGVFSAATQNQVNAMASLTSALTPGIRKIVYSSNQNMNGNTGYTFSNIPVNATRITLIQHNSSTSGTSNRLIKVGNSNSNISSANYTSTSGLIANAGASTATRYTTGFGISTGSASNVISGVIVLTRLDPTSSIWVCSSGLNASSDSDALWGTAGQCLVAGNLTAVQFNTVNGTDTYDSGTGQVIAEI